MVSTLSPYFSLASNFFQLKDVATYYTLKSFEAVVTKISNKFSLNTANYKLRHMNYINKLCVEMLAETSRMWA